MTSPAEQSTCRHNDVIPHRGRNERQQQEELGKLTRQVVEKLLTGITNNGMVSLFHDKESGVFDTAIFGVYFRSPALPRLRVTLWKRGRKPEPTALEEEKRWFGVTSDSVFMDAIEEAPSKGKRAITVAHKWDMRESDYVIIYRRDADKEAANAPTKRSNEEKIKFLREILSTEVDMTATEVYFGRPYLPGDTRSNNGPNYSTTHCAYWVRDIKDRLPALTNNSVLKLGPPG